MNPVLRAGTASLLTVAVSLMSTVSGCSKSAEPTPPQSQAAAPAQAAPETPPAQQMSVDDLVAPIALYPDQLLAQILTASINSQEVLDGGNWLLQNQNLKGDALTNAATKAGFSPSMQYLMSFPQVVDNMCQQIDWTRELGQAFQTDQKGVMEAVQRKRVQAQQTGNLKSSPQMTVETKKADNGQPYVEIQPANPQVVYVPQYNPVTIYTTPAPTTVVVNQPAPTSTGVSTGTAVAIGLLSFGVGMAVGAAINRNNYYPYPSWGYRGVYYGGRPYYPPPYRPVYPGYRPAYGYHPPPNYHWNQYNRNVNVNVNNNYYNKFNNNNNTYNRNPNVNNNNSTQTIGRRWGQAIKPLVSQTGKANLPIRGLAPTRLTKGPARPWQTRIRPIAPTPATTWLQPIAQMQAPTTPANRPSAGNNVPANRPNLASSPGGNNINRPNTANAAPMNRPNTANPGTMNKAAAPSNMNRGGDRGYSTAAARPVGGTAPAARPAPQAQNRGGGGNSAFSNSGSAKSERVASNRGQASMGGGGRARAQ